MKEAGVFIHLLMLTLFFAVKAAGSRVSPDLNGVSLGPTALPTNYDSLVAVAETSTWGATVSSNGWVQAWPAQLPASLVPQGLSNAVDVAVGTAFGVALERDGSVAAWGSITNPATSLAFRAMPTGLTNVVAIAAGAAHAVALGGDGRVYAWGDDTAGQAEVPMELTNATAIAAGGKHCLALRRDGTVIGWGDDSTGQLDLPSGASNVIAIAAGRAHSLLLRKDGVVLALGGITNPAASVPPDLTNVVAIAAGDWHSVALTADGAVVGWGTNFFRSSPTHRISAVYAAGWHTIAWTYEPLIEPMPASWLGLPGQSVVLTVNVTSGTPVSYQWRFNGTNLSGATNATLIRTNAQSEQTGLYSVQVSNRYAGTVPSATLVVVGKPYIATPPAGGVVDANSRLTLSATVLSPVAVGYQWQFNGADLAGATSSLLVLSNLQPANSGAYRLVASNLYGVTASAEAVVQVRADSVLDQSQTYTDGLAALRGGPDGNLSLGQTFAPGISGRLGEVHVDGIYSGIENEHSTTVMIVDTQDGRPGLNILGSAVVSHLTEDLTVSFMDQEVYLLAGTLYAIVLSTDAPAANFATYMFRAARWDTFYRNGALWQKPDSRPWAQTGWDLVFATYMRPGVPPIRVGIGQSQDSIHVGVPVQLTALVSPSLTPPLTVDFYAGSQRVGSTNGPPFNIPWVPTMTGEFGITATLTDGLANMYTSQVVSVTVAPAGPSNDDFANRSPLASDYAVNAVSNLNASLQPGEPRLTAPGLGQTVWFEWTPGRTAPATVGIEGTDQANALIGIYTGSAVDSLLAIANGTGRCVFEAQAGTPYQIQVDSVAGPLTASLVVALNDVDISAPTNQAVFKAPASLIIEGQRTGAARQLIRIDVYRNDSLIGSATNAPFTLADSVAMPGSYVLRLETVDARGIRTRSATVTVTVRPANDNFADAIELDGYSAVIEASNAGGTLEVAPRLQLGDPRVGEPTYGDNQGGHSIWYRWTAPASGICMLDGHGDGFDLLLGAYTGLSVSNLSLVAVNALAPPGTAFGFQVASGTTYFISVDGFFGEEGDLTWSLALHPDNDHFVNRTFIDGTHYELITSDRGATLDPGENLLLADTNAVSLWWSWQAPISGPVTFSTSSDQALARLAVYTGSSLTNLTPIAASPGGWSTNNAIRFQAAEGTAYQIAVFGRADALADMTLSMAMQVLACTSPLDGATYPAPATVLLDAQYPGGTNAPSEVLFTVNGSPLASVMGPPYRYRWQQVPAGTYTVVAQVLNAAGQTNSSLPVTMLVYTNQDVPSPRISAGPFAVSSYVINAVGAVYIFGSSGDQFGLSTNDNLWIPQLARVPVPPSRWQSITAGSINSYWNIPFFDQPAGPGYFSSWALDGAGNLYQDGTIPVSLPRGVHGWLQVGAGSGTALAVGDDGNLYLGGQTLVTLATSGVPWKAASIGRMIATLAADGRAFLHGRGDYGQPVSYLAPFPTNATQWIRVEANLRTVFLEGDNRRLYAANLGGLRGDTVVLAEVPLPTGVTNWKDFAAGGFHALAIGSDGQLYAWGRNWEGQLGQGAAGDDIAVPVQVPPPPGVTAWTAVAAGNMHSLAIGNDCSLYAWGANDYGQIGIGRAPQQPLPVRVANLGQLCGIPVVFTDAQSSPLANGGFRVQFQSALNRSYFIQYSDDTVECKTILPAINGNGGVVQWFDGGPPATDSLPAGHPSRFYRVVFAP